MNSNEAISDPPGPRVTVIIIFLNSARFIKEAIDSVFEQTFVDWELILVDDGSTDASRDIARDVAESCPGKVRYLAHPDHQNLGMSASRNLGIREARSNYIAFLDSDDVYLPERLARHVDVLDSIPQVAMVQSDHIQWYSWAGEAQQSDDDFVRPAVCLGDRILFAPQALLNILSVPWLGATPASMTVRRDAVLAVGGFEERFRDMYEDQVFTTKMYLEHNIYVMRAWLVKYRRHPESWTRYLKESGQFVDGLPHPTTDAFRSWLREYVESRQTESALLDEIVRNLTVTPESASLGRLYRLVTTIVGHSKALIERVLPRSLHRRLLRWDRHRRHARLRTLHSRLCDKVQAEELRRAGLKGVAER